MAVQSRNWSPLGDPPLIASTAAAQQSLTPPTSLKLASSATDNSVSLTWTASTSSGVNQYYVIWQRYQARLPDCQLGQCHQLYRYFRGA